MTEENKKKKKSTFLKVIKKIKVSHLIILAVLLAANSYAWFVYINTVSNKIDVHIKSWRIDFFDGTQPVTDYVEITANDVYPGMTTFTQSVYANNYSEVDATVDFTIIEANIMGEEYVTVEGRADRGETPDGDELTSAEVLYMLENDFPFTIELELDSNSIIAQYGAAEFTVTITWPYESGDDETDTEWGIAAYDFIENNPGDPCISLEIKITITQDEPSPEPEPEPEPEP